MVLWSLFSELLQFSWSCSTPAYCTSPPALPTHERRTTTSSVRRPCAFTPPSLPLCPAATTSPTSTLRLVTPRCIDRDPQRFYIDCERARNLASQLREYERAKHRSQPPRPETPAAEQQPDSRTARLVVFKLFAQLSAVCRFLIHQKVKTSRNSKNAKLYVAMFSCMQFQERR